MLAAAKVLRILSATRRDKPSPLITRTWETEVGSS
ncbi:hypothetical protein GALL_546620 [mine drainage metagenome]|uniref:Uncharacterized protein n=1 Tax=mine drainage metagenome TaxID=410659 RepID=A0A1J5PJT6_9ZZZZ